MNHAPATTQQILDKLRQLTEEEKLDLWRNAGSFLRGTTFTCPADLFHETVSLLLAGSRHWPVQVGFCCYMRAAMKSVAGSSRRLHANASSVDAPFEVLEALAARASPTGSPLDELLERERLSIAMGALTRAKAALAADPEAAGVVDGWLRAMSNEEIRSGRCLPQIDYNSAKKRALRAVQGQLPDRRI